MPDPITGIRHEFKATRDPASSDDAANGYGPGSFWINRTAGTVFVCTAAGTWTQAGASGAALPTDSLRTALDARDLASLTLDTSTSPGNSLVSAWATQADGVVSWAQGTAANRPQYKASAGGLAAPAVCFGAQSVQTACRLVAGSQLAVSGPVTVIAVVDSQETSSAKALLDSQTERRILSIRTSTGQVGWYDGTDYRPAAAAAVTGVQTLTWLLENAGGEIRRGRSTSVGTGAYAEGAWGSGGTTSLGTVHNSFSCPSISLYGLFFWAKLLSSAELTQAYDYIASEWGAGTGL